MDANIRDGADQKRGSIFRLSLIVWSLGLSQIVGYGTLYYSFAILADDAAKSFGWPVSWLFGSLSLGLLASGLIAPEVGRRIDRHGAGHVMAIGSGLSAMTLLAVALAPNGTIFAISVVAAQIASTFVLYDAAFAALVQASGPEARQRITHLTLIAGFASTIFWPLTAWLHGFVDWREVYLGFAAANLIVCVPIHVLLAHHHRQVKRFAAANVPALPSTGHDLVPPAQQWRILWLATIGFALAGFSLSAMLAQLVPLLSALGLGASALMISMLFGPAQVFIRFVNMVAGVRRHPIIATLVALSMIPLAIAMLTVTAPAVAGAALFALLLGFGSGLKSIVQGTLPLALFGSGSYGARLGFMASVRQALAAVAPFALAFLIEHVGIISALSVTVVVALAGLMCMAEVARRRPG